jgi:hypothetical protein
MRDASAAKMAESTRVRAAVPGAAEAGDRSPLMRGHF